MNRGIIETYCITLDKTIEAALRKIDSNRKGFVIVVNEDTIVQGTLTDGDIRRALLRGVALDGSIETSSAFCTSYTRLSASSSIDDAINIFKNGAINFIPVIDKQGKLINVLLKKQLYSLLLQCKNVDFSFDFSTIDETLIDFEVFNRPWGIYKTTILHDTYQAKILQVKPGAQLSLQYHNRREEYWVVASGEGVAQVGESSFILHQGSCVVVPRGCKHRLTNTSSTEYLIVSELQVGNYFGEDDIVRIEDQYGRA